MLSGRQRRQGEAQQGCQLSNFRKLSPHILHQSRLLAPDANPIGFLPQKKALESRQITIIERFNPNYLLMVTFTTSPVESESRTSIVRSLKG
jgi:hypothetical protein